MPHHKRRSYKMACSVVSRVYSDLSDWYLATRSDTRTHYTAQYLLVKQIEDLEYLLKDIVQILTRGTSQPPYQLAEYVYNGGDLRIVTRVVTERIHELQTELALAPMTRITTDVIHTVPITKHSVSKQLRIQRSVKRAQKAIATKQSQHPKLLLTEPRHDPEMVLEHQERTRYRKGFKAIWCPTRARYWKPTNNNWKQHAKVRKQWMKHL